MAGCGFLAPTALAGPAPAAANAPVASASSFDAPTSTGAPAASAEIPAAEPVATATTAQSAASTATATQQQPVNLVVIVRVNSPGNNGPITQQNVAVAPSIAANDASTAQSGGSAAASTSQQATPTATATQDAAGNYVITVRVDSAGSNGAVSQTNGVLGASSGTNTSNTAQQVAAPKPAVQPQARRAGAARSPQHSRVDRQPFATAEVDSAARTLDPVGMRPAHRHPAGTPARAHTHHQSTLSRIARGAVQALSPILPQAPPAANAAGAADVSRPVLLTLLVLAAAMAAFALVRRAMVPRQVPSRRPPR